MRTFLQRLRRYFWHTHLEPTAVETPLRPTVTEPTPGLAEQFPGVLVDAELVALAELPVVAYPNAATLTTQQWVTAELERRTGGITRHPRDVTQYPGAPTAADLAAKDWMLARVTRGTPMGVFTKGMSMRYLRELQRRAEQRDPSLRDEDLMALRARGLA